MRTKLSASNKKIYGEPWGGAWKKATSKKARRIAKSSTNQIISELNANPDKTKDAQNENSNS